MRWYSRLYVGEKAEKRRRSIVQGLRENRLLPEVYVITPPRNGNNVLDIYPSVMLLLPPYVNEDMMILGIAVTYWEALEVVKQMVEDMHRRTGGFCLEEFLVEGEAE